MKKSVSSGSVDQENRHSQNSSCVSMRYKKEIYSSMGNQSRASHKKVSTDQSPSSLKTPYSSIEPSKKISATLNQISQTPIFKNTAISLAVIHLLKNSQNDTRHSYEKEASNSQDERDNVSPLLVRSSLRHLLSYLMKRHQRSIVNQSSIYNKLCLMR